MGPAFCLQLFFLALTDTMLGYSTTSSSSSYRRMIPGDGCGALVEIKYKVALTAEDDIEQMNCTLIGDADSFKQFYEDLVPSKLIKVTKCHKSRWECHILIV